MNTESLLRRDLIRDFVIAGHGNLARVQDLLAQNPELLNAQYQWSENDSETAIQGAAQVGNAKIAEYLLAQGAPLDICTAAMLGRADDVKRLLDEDPGRLQARGAHGISLLAHAALSGDVSLARMLFERGAREDPSYSLGNAVMKGRVDMARWLIENAAPDLNWKNYEGKSLSAIAAENDDVPLVELLSAHGAA